MPTAWWGEDEGNDQGGGGDGREEDLMALRQGAEMNKCCMRWLGGRERENGREG